MSVGGGGASGDWQGFAQRIAEVTQMPADELTPDAGLMQGLGLDSLALAELVVALREAYDPDRQVDLERRNWQTITVAQLFEDFTGSRAPAGS